MASGVAVGSTTITAISGGLESTTTLTVSAAPVASSDVIVSSVAYASEGGKNNDKHLIITIELTDDMSNPVSDASVSIDLYRDGGLIASGTATTGSTGNVGFSLKNASPGTYTTTVTNLDASGLTWDGNTPDNSYSK